MHNYVKKFLSLLITQLSIASPLSDSALKLVKIGNEIKSPNVVAHGHFLLSKGMLDFNDLDAAYEVSKQVRIGNRLIHYPPQIQTANKILSKLMNYGYDLAIYDSALNLLDGTNGFVKDELMALNLFERSVELHANPQSSFIAAVIRNEFLELNYKNKQHIDDLITFSILNNVKGARQYQDKYINKRNNLQLKNWHDWLASQ